MIADLTSFCPDPHFSSKVPTIVHYQQYLLLYLNLVGHNDTTKCGTFDSRV